MPEKKPLPPKTAKELSYTEKVWHTVGIVAIVAILILIARVAFGVLLMALAGCLISVYFHGLGDVIQRKTKWKRSTSMIISIAGSFIILAFLLWFMGSKIQNQISALSDTLPQTIKDAKIKLAETPLGRKLLEATSGGSSDKLFATASQFFSTSFGVLGNMYIILFLGIFFTASPTMYKDGLILLIPPDHKDLTRNIINRVSISLKGWLKGTMLSMVMIIILLPIGLMIMGVPLALVLGLLAGILVIVPNFGSFAAMIPGVLLALTMGGDKAIIVALIYIGVQTLVQNIIAPIIQKKIINLPPALTIVGQLVMGVLGGAMGIIMAVPALVIVMILVDEVYVKKINPE
ncbi:AI-2E family transporter [Mucilaginibacter sp. BJC16-A38]|uniref:AI-2E family transporter n=1 Tax=Mucilaginibacter phenanthrenivorans TaxID=1234842 RepID=UPI0021571DBE|nr:AI-2E family transporter [Mucilaginibacter phenanthrenivorans]MCR8561368.1 AI-2E family transporter [Mucilaginibacter phenanthrenivorans]